MHKKHIEPDGEPNANSYFGEVTLHPFQCAANVPRPRWYCYNHRNIRNVKVIMNPAGSNILARGKSE